MPHASPQRCPPNRGKGTRQTKRKVNSAKTRNRPLSDPFPAHGRICIAPERGCVPLRAGPAAAAAQDQPAGIRPMRKTFQRAAAGALHTAALRGGARVRPTAHSVTNPLWTLKLNSTKPCLMRHRNAVHQIEARVNAKPRERKIVPKLAAPFRPLSGSCNSTRKRLN
jgi:hypothetical protein